MNKHNGPARIQRKQRDCRLARGLGGDGETRGSKIVVVVVVVVVVGLYSKAAYARLLTRQATSYRKGGGVVRVGVPRGTHLDIGETVWAGGWGGSCDWGRGGSWGQGRGSSWGGGRNRSCGGGQDPHRAGTRHRPLYSTGDLDIYKMQKVSHRVSTIQYWFDC